MKAIKAIKTLSPALLILLIYSIPFAIAQVNEKEEYWMGIYSGDKRVGYSHHSVTKDGGISKISELTNFKVNLLGKEIDVKSKGTYELEGTKIISFKYEMDSDTVNLQTTGIRVGEILEISVETASGITKRSIAIEEELILPSQVPELLVKNQMNTGDEFKFPLFEPLYLIMGTSEPQSSHTIGQQEILELPIGKFETYKVQSDFMGSPITSWITQKGEIIKQEFPPGLSSVRETKENILSNENVSFDVVKQTSIATNRELKDSGNLKIMKVELRGIDVEGWSDLNDGYRQYLDGNILEVKTQDPKSEDSTYSLPYKSKEYKDFIETDFLIQSDDKEIVAITAEVLQGETNPQIAAYKINNWIYKNLEKSPTASLPNAKDVLQTRVGDCNEHAALFSAMSRAAGIPTKTVLGIMYFNNNFTYHAWNEVYVGKWVAIDSTFGQFPADATHIKLIEGNFAKSAEISKLLGKLNIEIIDAS